MDTILGIQFDSWEFAVERFRVDTVGYDTETNSFVLVEYKEITEHQRY